MQPNASAMPFILPTESVIVTVGSVAVFGDVFLAQAPSPINMMNSRTIRYLSNSLIIHLFRYTKVRLI